MFLSHKKIALLSICFMSGALAKPGTNNFDALPKNSHIRTACENGGSIYCNHDCQKLEELLFCAKQKNNTNSVAVNLYCEECAGLFERDYSIKRIKDICKKNGLTPEEIVREIQWFMATLEFLEKKNSNIENADENAQPSEQQQSAPEQQQPILEPVNTDN